MSRKKNDIIHINLNTNSFLNYDNIFFIKKLPLICKSLDKDWLMLLEWNQK